MEERIRELEAELEKWQGIAESIADEAAKQVRHLRRQLDALHTSWFLLALAWIISAAGWIFA